jgi:S-DNA-T family DNA segregation ATPase FtsK/SpoIIIE
MGGIKYIIPFGTLMLAFSLMRNRQKFVASKIVLLILFFICICSIFTIYQVSKGNLNIDCKFEEFISQGYNLGENSIGGGAVGAFVAFAFIKLLDLFGAALVSIGLAFILLIFTFNIHPSEIIADVVDVVEDRRQENDIRAKEHEEKRLNRQKEREARILAAEKEAKEKQPAPINENDWVYHFNNLTAEEDKKEDKKEEEPKEEKKHILSIIGLNNKKEAEKVEVVDKVPEPPKAEDIQPDELNTNLFSETQEVKEDNTKQVLNLAHKTILEDDNYEFPPIQLLKKGESTSKNSKKAVADTATKLQKTLYNFKAPAKVENISVGPAITRYELKPNEGIRVKRIADLADDIAYSLAAESIRIEAPIPGKQAVGIEIPNAVKEIVHFREIVDSTEFRDAKSKLSMGLGKDLSGDIIIADIAKMPHVLIAGATGSGKSVCINTLIGSILYKSKPSEVRMIMIDPKVVELQVYNGIPHLLIPVVTEPKKAAGALAWAVQEMEERYQAFAQKGVRDLKGYNEKLEKEGATSKLPHMVIIIDELADLMMVSPKDVEDAICRLAQKARAAGMHLVIATQRPSVDVITGLIKANVPSRIAFAVASNVDSRTILDMAGAEKLLGKGDMLYYPVGSNKPLRVQGAFISDSEVESIVNFIKSNGGTAHYSDDIMEQIENSDKSDEEKASDADLDNGNGPDVLLMDAIDMVVDEQRASASSLQRRFNIGYVRAGRLIDQMYDRGIVSAFAGSKPRQVLITKEQWQEQKAQMEEFEKEHPEMKISH